MQFTPMILILSVILLFVVLLEICLFFWLLKVASHYNNLTKGIEEKTLMNALVGIQKALAEHEKSQQFLKSELQKLKEDARLHLQNLTFKRYNPFSDTGGDQSFILALLDGNHDGVVITSLHSRENTRFYVKSIKGGVGIDHPLSDEEQKMVNRKGK